MAHYNGIYEDQFAILLKRDIQSSDSQNVRKTSEIVSDPHSIQQESDVGPNVMDKIWSKKERGVERERKEQRLSAEKTLLGSRNRPSEREREREKGVENESERCRWVACEKRISETKLE